MKTENLYTPDCIRTYSGHYVNVFEPDPDTIVIEDIAHALSMQCRFGGHLPYFYSVAQHSTSCYYLAKPEHKLQALMHDASEAYLLDIPRPIKQRLANYKEIENGLMEVIADKFQFQWPVSEPVKIIDERMLQLEWDCLMIRSIESAHIDIHNSFKAKQQFLKCFKLATVPQPL